MVSLIKLSENEKRTLIVLLLVVIILFVLIGYISLAIKSTMQKQGSKADAMLENVVKAGIFKKENKLINFGIKKNIVTFYIEARVPFTILACSWIALLIYDLFTGNWAYNPLSRDTGFASLIPILEWPKENFFGLTLISNWPNVITPIEFKIENWFSYLFVPANVVGIIWFLICTQAYISRSFRVRQIAKNIYRKKLTD